MAKMVVPRRIEGWEFFDQRVEVCDVIGSVPGWEQMRPSDLRVADMFSEALGGCRRVLDFGCGSGFPGLLVASCVGELLGVDASPRSVDAARAHASRLGIANATFTVGGTGRLPYGDGAFNGIMLCGVLESMDWDSVHGILPEVRRLLRANGRITVLDQDWQYVLNARPSAEMTARMAGDELVLALTERLATPSLERDTRYVIAPESGLSGCLYSMLGGRDRVAVSVDVVELSEGNVLDAWYMETAQFDTESLPELLCAHGFADPVTRSERIWDQEILFVTART